MNSRRLPLIFLVLSFISLIFGLILGLVFDSMLFARMGSVVVLFGIMCEFSMLKLELALLYKKLENGTENQNLSPSLWHQNKSYMAHIMVVVGTLVWGFGDLIL